MLTGYRTYISLALTLLATVLSNNGIAVSSESLQQIIDLGLQIVQVAGPIAAVIFHAISKPKNPTGLPLPG